MDARAAVALGRDKDREWRPPHRQLERACVQGAAALALQKSKNAESMARGSPRLILGAICMVQILNFVGASSVELWPFFVFLFIFFNF